MNDGSYVDPDEMIRQLLAAGWKKLSRHMWQAPNGAYFRGPFEAWKAMRAEEKR